MNFIKKYFSELLLIVGIASLVLLVPPVIRMLEIDIDKYSIIYITYSIFLIVAAVISILLSRKGLDKGLINAGIIAVIASNLVLDGYNLIEEHTINEITSIIVDVLFVVAIGYSLIKVNKASYAMIPVGVYMITLLSSVFNGSTVAISKLLLLIVFIIAYFKSEDYSSEYYN